MENMEIPERRSATIYIDGDAIPRELKEAVYRAAERTRIPAVLVANSFQRIPASALVRLEVTGSGFDAADNRIVELARAGDLVITSDIPLADRVLAKGAQAFNSHGELFTPANIKTRLAMRDVMQDLRAAGEVTGGPAPFSTKHREKFLNLLNRLLTAAAKR